MGDDEERRAGAVDASEVRGRDRHQVLMGGAERVGRSERQMLNRTYPDTLSREQTGSAGRMGKARAKGGGSARRAAWTGIRQRGRGGQRREAFD